MFEKRRGMPLKILLTILLLSPILIFSDYYLSETETEQVMNNGEEIIEETNEMDTEKKSNDKVVLCFAGDVMMDSYFEDYINNFGVDYSWTSVAAIFQKADIAAINLETCVSERGKSLKREGYGFRSKPFTLKGLVNAGIDLVNLANNHTYDYGEVAFLDTLGHLEEYGILYSGAGRNIEEAINVKIFEKNNLKVGFLSFAEGNAYKAGDEKPGIACFDRNDNTIMLNTITKAKEKCDILIIMLHWGIEYAREPSDYQIELAHKIIEAGADGIIGHHPHVLQGIEIYKGKPILYSTGNFLFLKKNVEAGKTAVFELEFGKNNFTGGSFYPVHIDKCKAQLLEENDPMKSEIIEKLISLSQRFGTDINTKGNIEVEVR
jgi:poly-gamma-glutamate synthesis protein (capsule biosynthesis protein)